MICFFVAGAACTVPKGTHLLRQAACLFKGGKVVYDTVIGKREFGGHEDMREGDDFV